MITIEQALSQYTDMVNSNSVDMKFFNTNLNEKDKKEFHELAESIDLLSSYQSFIKFNQLFEKLDVYKNDIYNNLENVANFRGNSIKEETKSKLDEIFNEAFKDE